MIADIAVLVLIVAVAAYVIWRDRKHVKFTGIMLMRHTKRGRLLLDRIANGSPRFWRVFSWLGVIICIPMMAFISYFIINSTFQIIAGNMAGAVRIVLPATEFQNLPGVFLVPWYFWVIGIATVVVPHEFCHGIICRLRKIRVSSLGWFLFIIIPGAFVEPNPNSLKKAKSSSKLQVYAAGSFANIVLAVVFLLIGMAMMATLFTQNGVLPAGVINGTPAAAANLSGAFLSINGHPIDDPLDIQAALQEIPIGDVAHVMTTTGEWDITTVKNPDFNRSYLGIAGPYEPNYVALSWIGGAAPVISWLLLLFNWLFMINLGIGLFNLLPIKPLDGGLFFEEIVRRFTMRHARIIVKAVSIVMVLLVLFNIFGPIAMGA